MKKSIGMVLTPKFLSGKRQVENYLKLAINPIESSLLDQATPNSIISTTLNDLSNWARLCSLWPLLYGTSCCFIEFASLIGSRFDFDRYGLVPRSSPRQADLLITAGTVTMKMAPSLVRLYEQMPKPKYVIAMGACTITGGMFSIDSYSTVRRVDKLIPVDIYLPSCPPKPEAIIDAIIKLREKIAQEISEDRTEFQQGKRYFTRNHRFHIGSSIHTENKEDKFFHQSYESWFESTLEITPKTSESISEISYPLKNLKIREFAGE